MTDLTDLTKRRGAGGVETPAPPEALIPATTQWGTCATGSSRTDSPWWGW